MSKQVHKVAKGIAALGRGEDKMLVHMTPHEVEGLQRLAIASGGSLTINPHTGLVEAGWLSTLLPLIAGGAATVMSGGTLGPVAMAALQAGAGAVGGAAGAKMEGSDVKSGALFGALGGIGGGGLANSLATGATQGAAAAGNAQIAATNAAAGAATPAAAAAPTAAAAPGAAGAGAAGSTAAPAAQVAGAGLDPVTINSKYMVEPLTKENFGAYAQKGLGSLVDAGGMTPSSVTQGMKGTEKLAGMAGIMGGMSNAPKPKMPKEENPYYYITEADYDPNGFVSFSPGTWTKDYPYDSKYSTKMADGGEVDDKAKPAAPPPPRMQSLQTQYLNMMQPSAPPPGLTVDPGKASAYAQKLTDLINRPPVEPEKPFQQENTAAATADTRTPQQRIRDALFGKIKLFGKNNSTNNLDPKNFQYDYDINTGKFTKLAAGGIAGLAGGRFIEGPGDGTSDSVDAEIVSPKGSQKAKLADGEFVIDARTVAEIGNGSSKAGARALYAMMDRAHKMRTKPGMKNNPRKIMPV